MVPFRYSAPLFPSEMLLYHGNLNLTVLIKARYCHKCKKLLSCFLTSNTAGGIDWIIDTLETRT